MQDLSIETCFHCLFSRLSSTGQLGYCSIRNIPIQQPVFTGCDNVSRKPSVLPPEQLSEVYSVESNIQIPWFGLNKPVFYKVAGSCEVCESSEITIQIFDYVAKTKYQFCSVEHYLHWKDAHLKDDLWSSKVSMILDCAITQDREKLESRMNQGVSIDASDSNFRSALHFAAIRDDISAIKFLLENGANPCWQNRDSWSALDFSAFLGHKEAVETLLDSSIECLAGDIAKLSAVELAKISDHLEIADLISLRIAKNS